jgi:hypothetical protein
MNNPIVTVVLPCHGSLPFMKETIDSLLHQSFPNFEVIVVNDRVSADYLDYVNGLNKIDSRIKVIESKGQGISSALNTGIGLSKSELIARIDADDKMDPQRLEFQLGNMRMGKEILCVGTQLKVIDEHGELIRHTSYPETSDRIREMMKIKNVIAHPSVMFRKEAVLEVGAYRSFFDGAEDYDLWLRLMKIGEIINLDEPLTSYRVHSTQETQKNREYQLEMDSITRLCAVDESLKSGQPGKSSLKSMVTSENVTLINLLKKSTLSREARTSLLSAHSLNVAMSNPNFANLLRALCVFAVRPGMFFTTFKYSFSRLMSIHD